MGLCGCGAEHCAINAWWRVFAAQWKYIGWQMQEYKNEAIDIAIDFEREER